MTILTVFAKVSDKAIESDTTITPDRAREGLDTVTVIGAGAANIRFGQENKANSVNTQTCYEQFEQFDTSSIGAGQVIDSVAFSMVPSNVSFLVGTAWTLEARDFDWGVAVEVADFRAGSGLGALTLLGSRSSSGLAVDTRYIMTEIVPDFRDAINKTGDTRLFCSSSRHRLDQTEAALIANYLIGFSADEAGTTKDPRLIVNHSDPPTAALTGTITDDNEADIRAGGSTIILTLSDATYVTSAGGFDGQRQGIIDGLESAQAEPNGWDAVARPAIPVGNVLRTSATVVTITMPAVPTYNITADEIIESTIPASAHSGADAIIATPTFTIAFVLQQLRRGQIGGLLARKSLG